MSIASRFPAVVSPILLFYTLPMNLSKLLFAAVLTASAPFSLAANEPADSIRKAARRSTLNQSGTKPFHLLATIAPSRPDNSASNLTGQIEIWWKSPAEWRRQIRTPEFQQTLVVNGPQSWQNTDGDYFPEWLRELAVALINPVPDVEQTIRDAAGGDSKRLLGNIYYSWMIMSSNGSIQKGMGATVAINSKTGLLLYAGGNGWGGAYSSYEDFHGRMVARAIEWSVAKATVTSLTDLKNAPPDLFSTGAAAQGPQLDVQVIDERALRANMQSVDPSTWPPVKEGPLEGALTTQIVVDRNGQVREVGTIVTDNGALSEAARQEISSFHFSPFLQNGVPVQVVSRITLSFKTIRPAAVETFDSARNYFENGRLASFPSAREDSPYLLHATFRAKTHDGTIQIGQYTDSWKSKTEWRREITLGGSNFIRTQNGDTRYRTWDGPDAGLLLFLMRVLEPIPALDTFVESDWRMNRENVADIPAVRVLTGYESPEGKLDPDHARGFWFDANGRLVRAYFLATDIRLSQFEPFGAAQVARQIRIFRNGALVLTIQVSDLTAQSNFPASTFELPGHEWQRAFTDEVR